MPENLTIGFFAFGAVLILISLLGGGFKIFTFVITSTISNPFIRLTAFVLGIGSLAVALGPAMSPSLVPDPIYTSTPVKSVNYQPSPQPNPIVLQSTQTSIPPTQTVPPPVLIIDTPTPPMPNPTEFVISYWQNVSDGRYERAWVQLSPRFRQSAHNNDYNDYVYGYQKMNLCRIVVSNINLVQQDNYSAIVTAHFVYFTGALCKSSEYNFEMWLVYDGVNNSWLFDRNIIE
jgi:opacity protein-like surface antigen